MIPRPLAAFLWLTSALTIACTVVEAFCDRVLRLRYPYNWPLMPACYPFMDFALYEDRFAYLHSPIFFSFRGEPFMYPAGAAVAYAFFFQFPHPLETYLGMMSATALFALFLFGRKLVLTGLSLGRTVALLAALGACSYPFFFDFEQANIEWVIAALTACGVWAFLRGHGYVAAACFGVAGSMKLYPIVFVGLLISRQQYREFAAAVGVAVAGMLASLWLLCPDIAVAWHGMLSGLADFRTVYMLGHVQVGFDHSLFALAKANPQWSKLLAPGSKTLTRVLGIYVPVTAVAGVTLYAAVIRRLPVINQVICLTVAIVLLPPVSYDYTLLHLYTPWGLLALLAVRSGEQPARGLTAALVCFAILFAPESELIVNQNRYGGQVKALALAALFWIALRFRFDSGYDQDEDAERASAASP